MVVLLWWRGKSLAQSVGGEGSVHDAAHIGASLIVLRQEHKCLTFYLVEPTSKRLSGQVACHKWNK
jgi:hypothetical protein